MKKIVSTEKAPSAIGPYSQAVCAGKFMFVSGQLPIDPSTGLFAGESIEAQTKQSILNIQAILQKEGYELGDVIKTTVFLQNIADFSAMNGVYASFFMSDCPARCAFQVSALPKNALVEIEAVAYKD